jgi:hypothetical protein
LELKKSTFRRLLTLDDPPEQTALVFQSLFSLPVRRLFAYCLSSNILAVASATTHQKNRANG